MKKFFKADIKLLIACIVIITIALLKRCDDLKGFFDGYISSFHEIEDTSWVDVRYFQTNSAFSGIYFALKDGVLTIVIVILLSRVIRYRTEASDSGRGFLVTLPVKRHERLCAQILFESLVVVVSTLINAVYNYLMVKHAYADVGLTIPFLERSTVMLSLTCIVYAFMILSILLIVEAFVVNGYAKVAASAVSMVVGSMMLETLSGHVGLEANKIVRKIYQFFDMVISKYTYVGGSISDYDEGISANGWRVIESKYSLLYGGKSHELSFTYDDIDIYQEGLEFAKFGTSWDCLPYLFGYILITVLCICIAIWLCKRQELSHDRIYFTAGEHIISGIAALFFFMLSNAYKEFVSGKDVLFFGISITASLIVYLLVLFALKGKLKLSTLKHS